MDTIILGDNGQNGMFVRLLTKDDVTDDESGLESAVGRVTVELAVIVARVKVKLQGVKILIKNILSKWPKSVPLPCSKI